MQYDQTISITRNDGKLVEFDFNTDIHLVDDGLIGYVSVYFEDDTVAQTVHFTRLETFKMNLQSQIMSYFQRKASFGNVLDWKSGVKIAVGICVDSIQKKLNSIS